MRLKLSSFHVGEIKPMASVRSGEVVRCAFRADKLGLISRRDGFRGEMPIRNRFNNCCL
jgi:hypothetical protein